MKANLFHFTFYNCHANRFSVEKWMWEWWKCLCFNNHFALFVRSRQTNFGCDIIKTNWTKSTTTNIIIHVYFNQLTLFFRSPFLHSSVIGSIHYTNDLFGKNLVGVLNAFLVIPDIVIKPMFYIILFETLVERSSFLIYVWSQEAHGEEKEVCWSEIRFLISCVNFLQLKLVNHVPSTLSGTNWFRCWIHSINTWNEIIGKWL